MRSLGWPQTGMANRYTSWKRPIIRVRRSRSIGASTKPASSSSLGIFLYLELASAKRHADPTAPRKWRRASGARMSSSPKPAAAVTSRCISPEDDATFSNKPTVLMGGFCRGRKAWANSRVPVWAKMEANSASMSTMTWVPMFS